MVAIFPNVARMENGLAIRVWDDSTQISSTLVQMDTGRQGAVEKLDWALFNMKAFISQAFFFFFHFNKAMSFTLLILKIYGFS